MPGALPLPRFLLRALPGQHKYWCSTLELPWSRRSQSSACSPPARAGAGLGMCTCAPVMGMMGTVVSVQQALWMHPGASGGSVASLIL